jgi:hypothetical protein
MSGPAGELINEEAEPLLEEYCLLAETIRGYAKALSRVAGELSSLEELEAYDRHLQARERMGKTMAALGVKLRLAPSSRVHKERAGTIARKPRGQKPWE